MNTALIVIALVAVGTTAALLVYTMRLLRDERERSEARVAALSDAIAAHDSMPAAPHPPDAHVEPAPVRRPWPSRRMEIRAPETPISRLSPGARTPSSDPAMSDGGGAALGSSLLFVGEQEQSSAGRSRLLAPLAGALVVIAVVAGMFLVSPRSTSRPAAGPSAAAPAPAPLELVSLRHARKGSDLTISGVVRNPPAGRLQAHVTAVVFLFDRDGTFVTSGRAPLDYQQLAAGDESPFVVTVAKAGKDVARYRVSFRTEHDVVPHVDRRAAGTGAP